MGFGGIVTALATPFDTQGNINMPALERLIESNLEMGVSGFFVCGSSAEVFLLTGEERRTLMRAAKQIVGDRVKLIAHVGAVSTGQTAELGAYAKEMGYDAISSVAPFYHKVTFEEIGEYFRVVSQKAGLPLFVYNIPALTGVNFTEAQLCELLGQPHIIGVKHTSPDYMQLRQMKTAYPDKTVFNGYDETFLAGLVMGADGAIGSNFNFMADKFVQIHRLFRENRIAEAMEKQAEATKIIGIIYRYGLSQSIKAILKSRGLDCGVCRAPLRPLSEEDEQTLIAQVTPLL